MKIQNTINERLLVGWFMRQQLFRFARALGTMPPYAGPTVTLSNYPEPKWRRVPVEVIEWPEDNNESTIQPVKSCDCHRLHQMHNPKSLNWTGPSGIPFEERQ